MELTLDQALQKGVEAHKAGKVQEADQYYTAILKANPKHPDANHNMGVLAVGVGKIPEALPFFKTALEVNPNIAQYWMSYIEAFIKLDRIEDAKALLEQARTNQVSNQRLDELEKKLCNLLIQPELTLDDIDALIKKNKIDTALKLLEDVEKKYSNSFVWNELSAQCMRKLDNNLLAVKFFEKCLEIKPISPVIHKELGNVFLSLNLKSKAIKHYKKSIEIKSDYAHPYNNIAAILTDRGLINEAINFYLQAIKIDRSFSIANRNLSSLLLQLQEPTGIKKSPTLNYNFDWDDHVEDVRILINGAISHFVIGAIKDCEAFLKKASQITNPDLISNWNEKENLFYGTYQDYLRELVKNIPEQNIKDNSNYIYHIGESHCLSFAHHCIRIKNVSYKIIPRITLGAKAFHFAVSQNNRFKGITKLNLTSIPANSTLFISFGEIDCRISEGFISAASKQKKPIENLITDTVKGFINWFFDQNKNKNHKIFFLNVPAPIFNKQFSTELNKKAIQTIKNFNDVLAQNILERDFKVIDVFKFTVGPDGFSDGLFHIDDTHLSSKAVSEIEKQISR